MLKSRLTNFATKVHDIMGVSQVSNILGQKQTFSNNMLRLEIIGPD